MSIEDARFSKFLPKLTAAEFAQSSYANIYGSFREYEAARLATTSFFTIAKEDEADDKEKTTQYTNPMHERALVEREDLQAQYNALKKALAVEKQKLSSAQNEFYYYPTTTNKDNFDALYKSTHNHENMLALLLDFIGMRNDTIRRTGG